ncbi:thaumatin-like protein 1 [Jatropha curcas]|uniref:thaumatin-like protein 1 n=1 Tax=Jatropha curcas TaxID=180498 RepID=UPI0005FBEF24|nr:thaumatin-like protein 1 [Jatropha curcas]
MAIEAIFGLSFVFFFTRNSFFLHADSEATTFTITNNCPYTIWPATLTGSGNQLSSTGFELPSKASLNLIPTPPWSGRFWVRTGCTADSTGKFSCATGDCASGQVQCNGAGGNPPASLAEFYIAPDSGKDFYDISLVDGFNLPISITPQGGTGSVECQSTGCSANVNTVCPQELAVNGEGGVIGCKSACVALGQPQYCCTSEYGTPEKCPPTSYSLIFKNQCPQAYSYPYDDKTSTFTCSGGANYLITFCPYYSGSGKNTSNSNPENRNPENRKSAGHSRFLDSFYLLNQGVVTYELSLIHGHNLGVRVEPHGGILSGGGTKPCPTVDCVKDIGSVCPAPLMAKNENGVYVGCYNPCDVLNDPKCCQENEYSNQFMSFSSYLPWG